MNSNLFPTTRSRHRLIVAAVVWVGLTGSAAAATSQSECLTVRLMPEVTLDTVVVKLGQIAEITGPETEAQAAGQLVVAENVTEGSKFVTRAWKVSELLSQAGVDLARVTITGSAACRAGVVRSAGVPRSPVEESAALPLKLTSKLGGPASLEARIRRIICERLREDLPEGSRVKISFTATVKPLLAMTDPPYTFRIARTSGSRRVGLLAFKVGLYKGGKLLRNVRIQARVEAHGRLWVACRTINRKAQLGESDVEQCWREIKSIKQKFVTDLATLTAGRARRMIPAGTVITADLLESKPLVKRGQLVNVICRRRGLEIKMAALAMQTGFKDQLITVRNERSKQTFQGRAIRPGVVLVQADRTSVSSPAAHKSEVSRP